MVSYVRSIEQVETVFDTGDKPLLVHCNDFNYYVAKYNTKGRDMQQFVQGIYERLLSAALEFTGTFICLCTIAGAAPACCPAQYQTSYSLLWHMHNNKWREVDAFIATLTGTQKKKFTNKTDLLKIALYNYWVSNEDKYCCLSKIKQ